MKKTIFIFICIMEIIIFSSHAYIDPGTGGLILTNTWTLITGVIGAAGALVAVHLISPIKRFIRRLKNRNEKK